MLDVTQFRDLIIAPTLEALGLSSPSAIELLLGTAIQESRLTFVHQLGGGPALGLYQMEPATHDDIWRNYLAYKPDLAFAIASLSARSRRASDMVGNLWYATGMARVHYLRKPGALPAAGDVIGMAQYWKRHYNTYLGSGTVEGYVANWERFGKR